MRESFIRVLYTEIKRMLQLHPYRAFVSMTACFASAALSAGYTICFKNLVEHLSLAAGNQELLTGVLQSVLFFGVLLVLNDLLNAILNYQIDKQRMYLHGSLKKMFFQKVQKIPMLEFEKAEFLDTLNKANAGMEGCVSTLLNLELILGNSVGYLILIAGYLSSIHPLLGLVVLSVLIPTIISYFHKKKLREAAENQSPVLRRRMARAEAFICNREYFKETRHLRATEYFKKRFVQAADSYVSVRTKEAWQRFRVGLLVDLSYFLGFMLTIGVMGFLVYRKEISVGSVAAVIVTIKELFSRLNELFGIYVAGVVDSYTGLQNFHVVMQKYEQKEGKTADNDLESLVFDRVSFCYPGSQREALKNVSFRIKKGETVCVVGENGSGKTTLSKLLLGLYFPTAGKVRLNGEEITEKFLWKLKQQGTAVFQDYNSYALSLKENVFLGDIEQLSEASTTELWKEFGLEQVVQQLPEGETTMLSKEFGGTDVSMGQWQRIAIARGMLKKTGLIILDEPTAAIDPLLELEILNRLLESGRHSTKVIITHRIGIATKADRIFVMKHGELAEEGTHEELMRKNGEYARLFRSQSQWYQDKISYCLDSNVIS